MAKPSVFISSTYYDLKHIRNDLESFVKRFGFEPVLFERGQIAYEHKERIDESCYKEIKQCQLMIIIIGGRYGTATSVGDSRKSADELSEEYYSITREEYMTAVREGIPIFIFIEKAVHNDYGTYSINRDNAEINFKSVDNINIFKFIDDIYMQTTNNAICEFDSFDDIEKWLVNQWSGLFYNFLIDDKKRRELSGLTDKIAELGGITGTLKTYLETLLKASNNTKASEIIASEEIRLNKLRQLRDKSKVMNTPMMEYLVQNSPLDEDGIFEVFLTTSTLLEFINDIKLSQETIEKIKLIPDADKDYRAGKNMLIDYA